jgi:hypothetical protein
MNDAKHVQAQGFPPHPTANCPGFRDGFLEIVSGILTHFNVSTEIAVIFLNQVSKVTQSVLHFLQLHFDGSGLRVAQEKDHLHRTRPDRNRSRVRDFIVNNPLRVVR